MKPLEKIFALVGVWPEEARRILAICIVGFAGILLFVGWAHGLPGRLEIISEGGHAALSTAVSEEKPSVTETEDKSNSAALSPFQGIADSLASLKTLVSRKSDSTAEENNGIFEKTKNSFASVVKPLQAVLGGLREIWRDLDECLISRCSN